MPQATSTTRSKATTTISQRCFIGYTPLWKFKLYVDGFRIHSTKGALSCRCQHESRLNHFLLNWNLLHPISRRRLPLQRPKGVSGRGMRVPLFFCV
ncbi:hypothetical protein EPB69_07305 [Geobacillus stearothermophilus]|nr:hypothetical protein CV945_11815 [Geobacillus sp. Manikaran-105]QHN49102.1 hypothetical protein EPB69_07305 [Geobacillus stearothermophilus]